MISVENHIPVKKEFRTSFEERFKGGTSYVQNSPGFIRNEVLRPIRGDGYIIRTYWDTMESFEAWSKSDAFKRAHSNAPSEEMFEGKSFLTIHEVISHTGQEPTG
jgi:heme-degrading monooxygenase HmoA